MWHCGFLLYRGGWNACLIRVGMLNDMRVI